uniref:Geranylgeranyl transferase type-2 subunit alpha n=1 Tax=Strigamia maritima TaxID=126957 RepID=T1JKS0_STRMM
MHGRLKVKTTAEQQEEKRKERAKKLVIYKAAITKTFQKRENKEFDDEAIDINHQLLLANPDITTEGDINDLFNKELSFTESCLRVNPKSYGAWFHRCWVLDTMPNPDWQKEHVLCDRFLELDERNFHCWDHRRFVVKRANISPEEELKFSIKLINSNFSNYSAWHYRSKLLPLVYPDRDNQLNIREDIRLEELDLVQNAAFTDPNDQSAWFYHRWLLGKAKPALIEEPVKLLCLYVNRAEHFLIVTMKKAVNLKSSCYNLKVTVDKQIVDGNWRSTSAHETVSCVWILDLPPDVLKIESSKKIDVSVSGFFEETKKLTVVFKNNTESWAYSIPDYSNYFRINLSAAETSLLENELESCIQLKELEPDNKWACLTTIFLMRVIDPDKYETEILTQLRTLELSEIDVNRINYYRDMYSKFLTENIIKGMPLIPHCDCDDISQQQQHREVKIPKDLTAIYNFEHLILVTKLDLSNNQLRSLKQLHPLQCLRELLVASNLINDCSGLENLSLLESVDLDNNKIETTNDLAPLKACSKLTFLSLLNNPIENQYQEANVWIKENLPHLSIFKYKI